MTKKLMMLSLVLLSVICLTKAAARIEAEVPLAQQLIDAAKSGDLQSVKNSLASGVNVNSKDEKNRNALHWASFKGNLDIVEYLILNGADINAKSATDLSALDLAILSEHIPVVKCLLSAGARMEEIASDNSSTLTYACNIRNKQIIDLLLESHKENIDKLIGVREIASVCEKNGNPEILKKLLNIKAISCKSGIEAIINSPSPIGIGGFGFNLTPLELAVISGASNLLELLISYGAKVKDRAGNEGLMKMLLTSIATSDFALPPAATRDEIFNLLRKKNWQKDPGDYRKTLQILLEYGYIIPKFLPSPAMQQHIIKIYGPSCNHVLIFNILANENLSSYLDMQTVLSDLQKKSEPLSSSDFNTLDGLSMTPLMYLAARGNAKSLLDLYNFCKQHRIAIDFTITNEDGQTALSLAHKHKKADAIVELNKFLKPYLDGFNETISHAGLPHPIKGIILQYLLGL